MGPASRTILLILITAMFSAYHGKALLEVLGKENFITWIAFATAFVLLGFHDRRSKSP